MIRSLYLKPRSPGFKLHSYYADLISTPIPGWQVLAPKAREGLRGPGVLRQLHVALHRSSTFWNLTNLVAPILERLAFPYTSRAGQLELKADLTYCANHLQTRSPKWVADCEHVAALTGYYDPGVVCRWVGRRLQDKACRGFYCWSGKAFENSKKVLGNNFPAAKSQILYPATSSAINVLRDGFDGSFRICHMTTHRSSLLENVSNFYVKGTRDVLLLLKLMARTFPGLTRKMDITIRAWCPPSYVAKLRAMGVKLDVIENPLTRVDAMTRLANSDIVLMPCHSTPTMAFVEAMSRGVPVIANDVWANSEYLLDGRTGVLVAPPLNIRYSDSNSTPLWYRPGFNESLRASVDSKYLNRHAQALSYLLEDENQLRSLKAKTEVHFERSDFNIERRNRSLSALLDKGLN